MLAEGQITDWGIFEETGAGYTIGEGTEADTVKRIMRFKPYLKCKVYHVLSIDEMAEIMKSMTG